MDPLKDPLNFIDCFHFMVVVKLAHFSVGFNSTISFIQQVLRTILLILVLSLILVVINQTFIHFELIMEVPAYLDLILTLLFLFLIFFLFSFYNLSHRYLHLSQDYYRNLTVLFFFILLFFYVVDL